MTMSLVCTSTNTISKQEHMATPSLNDQPFIDTTEFLLFHKAHQQDGNGSEIHFVTGEK